MRSLKLNRLDNLAGWSATVMKQRFRQGFDKELAWKRLDELIDRYEDGWKIQKNLHLNRHNL